MKTPLAKQTGSRMLLAAVLVLPLMLVSMAQAEPRRFVIDDNHFTASFLVDHAGYARVLGSFLEIEGEFVYDEQANALQGGSVTIHADSIFTNHEDRDAHVRDEDFLHVSEHPRITFEATQWSPGEDNTGVLTGDLTMLGTTKPIDLDVTINRIGDYPMGGGLLRRPPYVIGASLRGTVRRSEYGMTYALENDLVGDEVDLILEVEARRQ
ncbi:MAG: YceI family protein [Aquisalimonadaceae bacterium]